MVNLSMSVFSHKTAYIALFVLWPVILSSFSNTVLGMLVGFCKYRNMKDLLGASHCFKDFNEYELVPYAL